MKFGKWTVLERGKSRRGRSYWICVCECNPINKVEVAGQNLRNGKSKSCGCVKNKRSLHSEARTNKNKTKKNRENENIPLEFNGEIRTLKEWSELIGIRYDTLVKRYIKKMDVKDILKKENIPRFKDISGRRFGRLTVLSRGKTDKSGSARWWCKCDCGNENFVLVRANMLLNGNTKSCGCLHKEILRRKKVNHDKKWIRLYETWCSIKKRCYNKRFKQYKDYGGRGIEMCDEWKQSFEEFYTWSLENGYNDKLTIDRIDNNLGYEPMNCKWVTQKEQNRNKRNNIIIEYKGVCKLLVEWAEEYRIDPKKLRYRYHKGVRGDNLFAP